MSDASQQAGSAEAQSNGPTKQERSGSVLESLARVSLISTTVLSFLLTRAIFAPKPLYFIIAWPASELVHFMAFFQALNLWALSTFVPSTFDSLTCKIMLVLNFLNFTWQARAFKDLISCRDDFSRAFREAKIEVKSGRSKLLFYASLIPLFAIARRGKRLRTFSQAYAPIHALDPNLVDSWNGMSRQLKNLQLYVGRDSTKLWTSLDVTTTDPPPPPGAPVLLYIHGGGWMTGSKFFACKAALERVASRGIVVVSINYRLAPERAFPAQILDCKRALIYVKRHCVRWNGDPNKVFVCGESAGGHLSALVGTTGNMPEFQPPETLYEDTSVAGAIPLYGVMDFTDAGSHQAALHPPLIEGLTGGMIPVLERMVLQKPFKDNYHDFELASPLYHVTKAIESDVNPHIPPFMVVHGTRDALAAFDDSKAFYDALLRLRDRFREEMDVFVEVNGGHHAFGYIVSPFSMALGDAIVDFVLHQARKLDDVD